VTDVETPDGNNTTVTEAPKKERALTNATVRNPISGTKKIDKARKEKKSGLGKDSETRWCCPE